MEALTDIVVILHLGYFVFVFGGFLCIVIGAAKSWRWISNSWFRFVHLLAIFFVLAEDVGHFNCPLNVLESKLRSPVGDYAEGSSMMSYLLYQLLHHTIPGWALDRMYWILGLASLVLLFLVPAHIGKSDAGGAHPEHGSPLRDISAE
jgi:hypothetical protein